MNSTSVDPLVQSTARILASVIAIALRHPEVIAAVRVMMTPAEPTAPITVAAAARALNISAPTARKLVTEATAAGVNVAVSVGRCSRVDLPALRAYLATRPARVPPTGSITRPRDDRSVDVVAPLRSLGLRPTGGAG